MVDDCLFCKIVTGEVPADVVREGDRVIAFRDISPKASTHVLVIPRDHHPDLGSLAAADPDTLVELVRAAQAVAEDEGVTGSGWRFICNTGPDSGQVVFHAHAHVIGGRRLGAMA